MLDAEDREKRENLAPAFDEESMAKVEKQGLCSEASLDIFVHWYTLGGMNRGLTLTELLEMPTWLRQDFTYILREIARRRKERELLDVQIEEMKGKSKRGRRSTRKSRR